jgi:hypothetical protein
MLTLLSYTGIDNQRLSEELEIDMKTGVAPLAAAMNVDLDLDGKPRRRAGYVSDDTGLYRNIFEGTSLTLATKAGDLVNVDTADVLYPSLSGSPRTWYTQLPDGRVTFSNGLICGITDGTTAGTTAWGVPIPADVGSITETAGSLKPGRYRWQVTHVRIADGLEGGPAYSAAVDLTEGGIEWTGLPDPPAGHTTNVYLTSHNDDIAYLAATTSGNTATFTGANEALQLDCKTDFCYPAPAGILTAYWRGRMLIASGNLLLASKSQRWELFDLAKDFKQFSSDLTLVQPVDGGIWVGTGTELAFLSGTVWDELEYKPGVVKGAVCLGSGVDVDATSIKGAQNGNAMMCIANGYICAGFSDGSANLLSFPQYRTDATEVAATFRMNGAIPQYIAIPQ